MTAKHSKEEIALQCKLDNMLVQAIADVEALGYDVYEIEPKVRMTNNKSRLGSAQVINGAHMDAYLRKRLKQEKWDKPPVFRISVSRRECKSDEDIRNVLYHEVIHCVPGCCNHGKMWKSVAAKVNAAYGTDVQTTKKELGGADDDSGSYGGQGSKTRGAAGRRSSNKILVYGGLDEQQLRRELEERVGQSFSMKNKTYTFTGFNTRPKRCCDLVDAKGNAYICNIASCAHGFGLV